jgi:UDP-N-acetylglucosamine 1-carboxyvinyltransferase
MGAVQYVVEGPTQLKGSIRPSGNKNAALPILAACLLSHNPVRLRNVPRIRDMETLVELVRSLGVSVEWTGQNELFVHAAELTSGTLDPSLCARIRASILLAAPVLARLGEITLPPPGGDVIGRRRVDTHYITLGELGAQMDPSGRFGLKGKRFKGADVFLDEPSVTATENALMAAASAEGETVLRNCASEPHVQDLADFLRKLGADIDGIGTNTMRIRGTRDLGTTDVEHTIGPDHIEVGSFIGLAAVTRSEIRIVDAGIQHLHSTRLGFARLGIQCRDEGNDLVVSAEQSMEIQQDLGGHIAKLEDQPWPAFPADTMSIAVVTATQCKGIILMHEKMFESRLFFVDKLISMGARIILCDPHRAIVTGPSRLTANDMDSPDIRAGMALLVAAMCATGTSRINNVGQIERGYERIDERLNALGAQIERVHDRRSHAVDPRGLTF